ncbi:MAG TPA: T9SS type A sorting domain-containing protein [Candidatus Kapabacteria bacterium]|nr:T9SS type A sorting domain-containing protein [Candidatus Kapabacteria bacterium]
MKNSSGFVEYLKVKLYIILFALLLLPNSKVISQNWFKLDKPNLLNDGSGYSTYDQSISVKSDMQGNIYHTGYFEGIIVFGNDTLVSNGGRDIFVAKLNKEGQYKWAKSAGSQLSDYGKDIAINQNGEVFLTGYFFAKAYFGNYQITSFGNSDIFVAKLDSNGNWLWVKNADGDGFDRANSITADNNYCYISGNYESSITFANTTLTSQGSKDIFVAKIDKNGNWKWAKSAGSSSTDDSYNINFDANKQKLIITGYFSSTATFGLISLTSAGSRDPYVAKIDTNGNWIWAKRTGSSNSDEISTSVVDDNNDIFVAGFYSKTFKIDTTNLAIPTNRDIWIAKLDSNGNWKWAKTLKGPNDELIYSISYFNNALHLSGGFEQSISNGIDTVRSWNLRNAFYAKIDKNGNFQYLKSIRGNANIDAFAITTNIDSNVVLVGAFNEKIILKNDTIASKGDSDIFTVSIDSLGSITNYKINYGFKGIIKLLASDVDKNKDIILCGYYYGNVAFANTTLQSVGKKDAFIAKYNLENGFLWAKSIGSIADDEFRSVVIDSSNNYYVAGYYSDTINVLNQNYPSAGMKDILVAKFDSNGNMSLIKTYGGIADDNCNSLAIYANNIAITGTFSNSINFDGTNFNAGIYDDIFVLSSNLSLVKNWVVKAGGNSTDNVAKIIADTNNDLYIAGSYEDIVNFAEISLTSNGGDDMYIAKINSSGVWQWAKSIGTSNYVESANCLTLDNNGNIYVAGNFKALMEVEGDYILHNGDNDIFLGKITNSGNWIWKKNIGGTSSDIPYSLNFKNDNIYLTSSFKNLININGKIYTNNGNNSSLITILDKNGAIINSYAENNSFNSTPMNLLFLKNNNFVLTGNFQYNITIAGFNLNERWNQNDNIYLAFFGIEPIYNKWKPITNTGKSSEIILPKAINPTINMQAIEIGDAVGIFYYRNSNLYCAGYGVWDNSDLHITIWGDNSSTLVKDGMADNENYVVKTWKATSGIESIVNVKYSSGPSKFIDSSQSIISKFPFYYDTLQINLNAGWNLISSNVLPRSIKLDSIFMDISDDISIVKNSIGKTYIPAYGINTIGNWNLHQGYQVYAKNTCILKIIGESIKPENEAIIVKAGWSYLAYLRNSSMNIATALSSIVNKGKLVIAKNSSGKTYIPAYGINSIGNMVQGKAYQVYLTTLDTLTYPDNLVSKSTTEDINDYIPKNLSKVEINNLNNSTLIIETNSELNDYELAVFGNQNNLVGSGRIVNGLSTITIFANDEVANYNNYLNIGDNFIVKLYDKNGQFIKDLDIVDLEVVFGAESFNGFKNNQIYKLRINNIVEDEQIRISPNPSSDYISVHSKSVINNFECKIYNIDNKLVLQSNNQKINIKCLPNGTYYIHLMINDSYYFKKIIKID